MVSAVRLSRQVVGRRAAGRLGGEETRRGRLQRGLSGTSDGDGGGGSWAREDALVEEGE